MIDALLGAAGFIRGSYRVSRDEWRTYVDAIGLRENFISPAKMNADLARSRSLYQELFTK